jgi:hypothetical protein
LMRSSWRFSRMISSRSGKCTKRSFWARSSDTSMQIDAQKHRSRPGVFLYYKI